MDKSLKQAINEAVNDILSLSPEELQKVLQEHKDGDVANFIKDMGVIEVNREQSTS